jgi:hypothetical protein
MSRNGARTLTEPVEQSDAGAKDRAAVRQARDIGEDVDTSESSLRGRDDRLDFHGCREVRDDCGDLGCVRQRGRDGREAFRLAVGENQPGNAARGEQPGRRLADALRGPRDHSHLAIEPRPVVHAVILLKFNANRTAGGQAIADEPKLNTRVTTASGTTL